jgi:hypothetical protein
VPILARRHYDDPSVFMPESLLRKARRRKDLAGAALPTVCVLDPDSDLAATAKAIPQR